MSRELRVEGREPKRITNCELRITYHVSRITLSAILYLLSSILCSHAELPPRAEFGSLEYPAQGNIQLDEGTVDLWVSIPFDTNVKELSTGGEDRRAATLFNLVFPEEKWHYVLYFIPWADAFAMVGYTEPIQRYIWAGPNHWKPGQSHHVVLTWSGSKRSVFIDGNCQWVGKKGPGASRDVEVGGPIQGELTKALIQIGRGSSFLTLDEIQIRAVALTPEEIVAAKAAPLTADADTLLLDHCDGGPAEVIGGQTGETAGKLLGQYEIVAGKFGKAIQLWKEKK